MASLEHEGNVKACLDGRVSSLLASMDEAGVDVSVVASIATRPEQFQPILEWSAQIASERLVPFPSVHPNDPALAEHVAEVARRGFKGIKVHPYYQGFDLDEPRADALFGAADAAGLIVLCHTGFDFAFPRDRIVDPVRITRLVERFPSLRFVASHCLAFEDWEEAWRMLLGRPIYTDIAFALEFMPREQALEFLHTHPREYILFGTDSPWAAQAARVEGLRALGIDDALLTAILWENGRRLLALP